MPNQIFSTNTGYVFEWSPEIGRMVGVYDLGRNYTDLAMHTNGRLYGITYNALYEINLNDETDKYIGDLEGPLTPFISSLNAAVGFDIGPDGTALVTSGNNSIIAEVDLSDGSVKNVGLINFTQSAGDVVFYDGSIFVSTRSSTLVELQESDGFYYQVGSDFVTSNEILGLTVPSYGDAGIIGIVGTNTYDLSVPAAVLGPGLVDEFTVPGGTIWGAASTNIVLEKPIDQAETTSDQLFEKYGDAAFMAKLALASYHLDSREVSGAKINFPGSAKSAAYFEIAAELQLLEPSDLPSLALVEDIGNSNFPTKGLANGIFTNDNAAALVARSEDALFIAFRGTNDLSSGFFASSPDKDDWVGKDNHFDHLISLVGALKAYADSSENGISKVFLTGHSLGAGMVEATMDVWAGNHLQAVTFASPGYGIPDFDVEPRITNIWLDGDPINIPAAFSDNDGDSNSIFHNLLFGNEDGFVGNDGLHNMTTYLAFVDFLQSEGVDISKINNPNGPDFDRFYVNDDATRDGLQIGEGDDKIKGGASDDLILGGKGNDRLDGGSGNDELQGGNGEDLLLGRFGKDFLRGGNGDDRLYGNSGDDILSGNNGEDELFGSIGDDRLFGGNDDDMLDGGRDNDHLDGGEGWDDLNGEDGRDLLLGRAGSDVMRGGDDNDRLYGGADNDLLSGNNGVDQLYGGSGNDRLFGGNNNDRLFGDNGNDELGGGNGEDLLLGREGNDLIRGNNGDDRLFGNDGNDTLSGGRNDDEVVGGAGNDRMFGGSGDDWLEGGNGADFMDAGSGADTFVFDANDSGTTNATRDEIRNFTTSEDMIDLSRVFDGTLVFVDSYTGAAGEVRYREDIGRLYVQIDGAGGSDFSIDLAGDPVLLESDLIL